VIAAFILLVLAGLVGGFLSGLIGVGGGTIYIFLLPVLLTQIGVPEDELSQYTIANSLFAIVFAALSANITNGRKGNFYWKEVVRIALPCTIIAALMTIFVVHRSWFSLTVFNSIVLILFTYMLIQILYSSRKEINGPLPYIPLYKSVGIGIISGALSAVSGLGGGIVTVPMLNSFCHVDIRKASSISLGVIMPTAIVSGIVNITAEPVHPVNWYSAGYIVFPVVLILSAGVIITSPLGVKAAQKMPGKYISYIYAVFLLLVVVTKAYELISK